MLIHSDKDLNYCMETKHETTKKRHEIACQSWNTASGTVTPTMFKMVDEDGVIQTFSKLTIKHTEKKKYAGTLSYEYDCTILVNGFSVNILLQFFPETCRWYLIEE